MTKWRTGWERWQEEDGTSAGFVLDFYLDLFKIYYNNNIESPLKEINFGEVKIPLSKNTKS